MCKMDADKSKFPPADLILFDCQFPALYLRTNKFFFSIKLLFPSTVTHILHPGQSLKHNCAMSSERFRLLYFKINGQFKTILCHITLEQAFGCMPSRIGPASGNFYLIKFQIQAMTSSFIFLLNKPICTIAR